MKITKRHIPFLISLISFLISFIYDLYFSQKVGIDVEIIFNNPGTWISLISLTSIAFFLFMKWKIWVYLYLAFIIASFVPLLGITGLLKSIVHFGSIPINIIALILLFAHLRLNGDLIQGQDSSQEK